ncbi:MAG: hypothetical protein RLO04_02155 [Limnobacter sp.]|uniref:hypothetical protein n=1 Tax=Limnobacter sp. TaxID=2003368 RepID=UPI0032ED5404
MSLDELSPEQIEAKQQELLKSVPVTASIGNKALRDLLGQGWTEDLYWAIRSRLIEHGQLEPGRGRGGSVRIVPPPQAQPEQPQAPAQPAARAGIAVTPDYTKEAELYEPISSVLRNNWSKEQGFDNYLVEITAKQGSRTTGGKWTRPDVTVVGYKTFPYLPGRFLEVISFEIKPTSSLDITAVYEALAHRRSATRAYVVGHVPQAASEDMKNEVEAVTEEAKKLGVGVIIADDPVDFDTWEVLLDADRVEPDPGRLNEFIARQTSPELREQIVRWFK